MNKIIMHIDVNNAFLSWTAVELLKQGYGYDIRNSYAVIGGDPKARKGIVLAKSMPAKKMGVVTGETLYSAKQKCPSLRVYPANYNWYALMSESFVKIIAKYTPDIEQVSIDECFVDYTGIKNLYGDPVCFAKKISKEIFETLGFTVNIGIAHNKLCAKMASDLEKPNKIHVIYEEDVKNKMWPLKVGELFGIGKKTSEKLINLGINTIGDLANTSLERLSPYFKNMAQSMIDSANGTGSNIINTEEWIPKGISNEITLLVDTSDKKQLEKYLLQLSEKVSIRLRKQKKYTSVVAVILKNNHFKRISHQKKLKNATDITSEIYNLSKKILNEMYPLEPVRLIGIRLDQLTENNHYQVSLFEDIEQKENHKELDLALDKIKNKYGTNVIKSAALIDTKDKK